MPVTLMPDTLMSAPRSGARPVALPERVRPATLHLLRRAEPDDAGITLVELIVYAAVAALFLGLLASLVVTGLKAEAATRERDTATGSAQVVSDSIQTSIRNSTEFRVDGSLLRARVATGATTGECRAWAISSGALVYLASAAAIPVGGYTGWATLASGVSGTLAGGVPFSKSGQTLTLGISVTTGDSTVPITGGVSAQAKSEGTVTPCW